MSSPMQRRLRVALRRVQQEIGQLKATPMRRHDDGARLYELIAREADLEDAIDAKTRRTTLTRRLFSDFRKVLGLRLAL